jgi:hypothetical protein
MAGAVHLDQKPTVTSSFLRPVVGLDIDQLDPQRRAEILEQCLLLSRSLTVNAG